MGAMASKKNSKSNTSSGAKSGASAKVKKAAEASKSEKKKPVSQGSKPQGGSVAKKPATREAAAKKASVVGKKEKSKKDKEKLPRSGRDVEEDVVEGALGEDVADEDAEEREVRFEATTAEDEAEAEAAEAEARDLDFDKVADEALDGNPPADDADVPDAADLDDLGLDDLMPIPSSAYGDDFDPVDMSAFAGHSVLGIEERNAVIQEVKQRAEKNGGYVTYDELNQIVPATVQDEATMEEFIMILQQLNVTVIRSEEVETYIANKDKKGDSRFVAARAQELFDDPIRMYLHQMGQVPLLTREQEVDICQKIENAEAMTKDMFNRFAFAPAMYMGLLARLETMQERFDRVVTDRFEDNRDAYMEQMPAFRKMLVEVGRVMHEAYAKYLEAIERKAITPETVRSVLQFNADGVQYTVDPPAREIYEDSASNNSSLITTVTHGDTNMLFLGDAEDARLQEYLAKNPRPCQVVKLPHHGRWHSALNALMAQTTPDYVIATSSSDELEDDQTVKLVNDSGAQLFLTRQAPVEITSSAQGLQVRYTDF